MFTTQKLWLIFGIVLIAMFVLFFTVTMLRIIKVIRDASEASKTTNIFRDFTCCEKSLHNVEWIPFRLVACNDCNKIWQAEFHSGQQGWTEVDTTQGDFV